jgi:hypothetical protein
MSVAMRQRHARRICGIVTWPSHAVTSCGTSFGHAVRALRVMRVRFARDAHVMRHISGRTLRDSPSSLLQQQISNCELQAASEFSNNCKVRLGTLYMSEPKKYMVILVQFAAGARELVRGAGSAMNGGSAAGRRLQPAAGSQQTVGGLARPRPCSVNGNERRYFTQKARIPYANGNERPYSALFSSNCACKGQIRSLISVKFSETVCTPKIRPFISVTQKNDPRSFSHGPKRKKFMKKGLPLSYRNNIKEP